MDGSTLRGKTLASGFYCCCAPTDSGASPAVSYSWAPTRSLLGCAGLGAGLGASADFVCSAASADGSKVCPACRGSVLWRGRGTGPARCCQLGSPALLPGTPCMCAPTGSRLVDPASACPRGPPLWLQRYIGFLRRSVTAVGLRCAVFSDAGGGTRAAELAAVDQLCLPQAFDYLST